MSSQWRLIEEAKTGRSISKSSNHSLTLFPDLTQTKLMTKTWSWWEALFRHECYKELPRKRKISRENQLQCLNNLLTSIFRSGHRTLKSQMRMLESLHSKRVSTRWRWTLSRKYNSGREVHDSRNSFFQQVMDKILETKKCVSPHPFKCHRKPTESSCKLVSWERRLRRKL